MVRDAVCLPPPQRAEHADQADQADTRQLTGQGCALHDCFCNKAGQAMPPNWGLTRTLRDCTWTPPPHVSEHDDHADHEPTTQLTGQLCVLHACDCDRAGHAAPPYATGVTTERVCVCTPPPHDWLHLDHDDHEPTTQFTGHFWTLHGCDCTNAGHAAPPKAGCVVTERVCDCTPVPHDLEHEDQAVHADTTQ